MSGIGRREAAQLALRCLDLTSLKDDDSEDSIRALAGKAATPHGAPAALCVYPQWVPVARQRLGELGLPQVKLATVVNFPRGDASPGVVAQQIAQALALGADEIDAVLPWRALAAGDAQAAADLVARCREACGTTPLKFILETGQLREPALIRQASEIALAGGADFIKTSTGKVPVNATPDAVAVMLDAIHAHGLRAGLKVAGGVSSVDDVLRYVALAAETFGAARLSPATLRFGASSLLPVLLAELDGQAPVAAARGY